MCGQIFNSHGHIKKSKDINIYRGFEKVVKADNRTLHGRGRGENLTWRGVGRTFSPSLYLSWIRHCMKYLTPKQISLYNCSNTLYSNKSSSNHIIISESKRDLKPCPQNNYDCITGRNITICRLQFVGEIYLIVDID